MRKIKSWIFWMIAVVLALYIVLAGRFIAPARTQALVRQVEIHIEDSLAHPYVKAAEIRQMLLVNDLLQDSLALDSVRLQAMEDLVASHPLVKKAEVYTRPSGHLRVDVWQRLPILRIIGNQGQFFLDDQAKVMEMKTHQIGAVVDVPVVTGHVQAQDSALLHKLYDVAKFLEQDDFWNAMITQMEVHADASMSLYLRLCDFEVAFGQIENIEDKMAALRSFYEDALPKLGWDRYEKISLEFNNQIVCTKKK